MEEEALRQRTDELEIELYGEGSLVSEEEIRLLVIRRQRERRNFARRLAEASELSGFSASELVEMLGLKLDAPDAYYNHLFAFVNSCEALHRRGYGPEIKRVLTTDGMFGRQGEEPFPALITIARDRFTELGDIVFSLPEASS